MTIQTIDSIMYINHDDKELSIKDASTHLRLK